MKGESLMCLIRNDVAEAYMDLLKMAENCKDPTEKAKLDWILLRFAAHFGAVADKNLDFTMPQMYQFTDFKMSGRYLINRGYLSSDGTTRTVTWAIGKYEPTEEYKSKFHLQRVLY